jgi:hypothetical protein
MPDPDMHDQRLHWRTILARSLYAAGFVLAALACNLLEEPAPTATSVPSLAPTPPATAVIQTATLPYTDANAVLGGLCYDFLQTLNGQTIILDSPADLSAFYDQADKSKRCPDAVPRQDFDFAPNQIVGTAVTARGCSLDATYDHTDLDDAAQRRVVVFRLAVNGDCDYGLVRPIWLAIGRPPPGYTTQLRLSAPP